MRRPVCENSRSRAPHGEQATRRPEGRDVFEPTEMYALLREVHLPALKEEDSRILAARVCGLRPAQIAERLFISERTVRRAISRLQAEVCAPSGADDDIAILVLWYSLHIDCSRRCAARALEMIETSELFPGESMS